MTVEAGVSLESRRTLKKSKLDVLDEALWIWFCQERRKGIQIRKKWAEQTKSLQQVKSG
jgi:hypothetical protein